jgi:hypothetical protein
MILYQMEKHLPAPSSPSLLPETVEREAGASQAGDTMRELGDGTVLLKPAGLVVIWKQIQDTRQCVRAQTAALKALEKRMRDQEMELRGVAHSELQAAWAQNWYIRQWLGEQRAEVEGCEILLSDLWVQADKLLASSSSHGLCPVWDQIQSIRLGLNQRAGELEGHQKQLDVQKEKISYHRSKALEEKKRDHERDAMLDDAVSKSFVFLVHPKRAPNASGKSYIDLRRQFLDDFRREGAGRGTTELGLAADCMADAALYASGERDDPVTLSAIYGVPPDRVTSLCKLAQDPSKTYKSMTPVHGSHM